jgi:BirA family biotin operon repressor/biotin-[acetyl-CoA-carboxylase] ligase
VLADGRKLAGILLESGQDAAGTWLTVGIGINLAVAPEGTEYPATAIADLGVAAPSSAAALTLLAGRFAHWYDGWMSGGFETLRTAWLARAGGLGLPIRARLASHEIRHGVFDGIDDKGALLLNERGRVSAISAGEVFF